MAGATVITKYADAIKAGALAFGGGNRISVVQGYKRYQDNDNWEQLVLALNSAPGTIQGYFSFWQNGLALEENYGHPTKFIGELAVPVPKDADNDMNGAWDLVYQFCVMLSAAATYATIPGGAQGPPPLVECVFHSLDPIKTGGIAIFDFGNYGSGGITFPDP